MKTRHRRIVGPEQRGWMGPHPTGPCPGRSRFPVRPRLRLSRAPSPSRRFKGIGAALRCLVWLLPTLGALTSAALRLQLPLQLVGCRIALRGTSGGCRVPSFVFLLFFFGMHARELQCVVRFSSPTDPTRVRLLPGSRRSRRRPAGRFCVAMSQARRVDAE